jgi:CRP-like cAMP-binding protein
MSLENCVVAQFPLAVLMKLISKSFNIGFFFIKYLSVEIGKSDDRTVNLTQKHIRARLAEGLIFLKDSYGLEKDGKTLDIRLSREDLANLCNMTTSNAIRTLSAFTAEELINTEGRKIKILQEEEIIKIAELG